MENSLSEPTAAIVSPAPDDLNEQPQPAMYQQLNHAEPDPDPDPAVDFLSNISTSIWDA